MDTIDQHIQKDIEILNDPRISPQSKRHIEEELPYGLYNMVSQGEASRYETAVAMNEYLNLGLTIHKVDSDYFKTEYFAPRPYSEKLINKSLNDLNKNYMRNWKVCLHEYLNEFFK